MFLDVSNYERDSLLDYIRKLVAEDGIELFFIDSFHYLRFYYCDEKNIADWVRQIKQLAKELKITIVMTSRVSYALEEREGFEGKLPFLTDTERIGDLNYYSDVVLGLYRPEVYHIHLDSRGNYLRQKLFVNILKTRTNVVASSLCEFTISRENVEITKQGERDRIF